MTCPIVVQIAVSFVCLMVGSGNKNNSQDMVVMVVLTSLITSLLVLWLELTISFTVDLTEDLFDRHCHCGCEHIC